MMEVVFFSSNYRGSKSIRNLNESKLVDTELCHILNLPAIAALLNDEISV